MAEKIIIASLDLDVKGVISSTQQLKQQLEQLKREQIALKNTGQESSQAFIENDVNIKLLSKAYNDNMKSLVANKTAMEDSANASEMLAIALEGEVRTIAEAREQNKLLNKLRNETNATTTEGQAQITQLNSKLDQNNAFIKENADQYLQQKINIGNYGSALQGVSPQLSGFVDQLKGTYASLVEAKEALIAQATATVGTTTATSGASKALNIFKIALISTGIGAIVVLLGLLFASFSKFTPVVDKVEQAMAGVSAVFNVVKNTIVALVTGTKSLSEAFSGLGGSMKDAANDAMALKKAQQDLEDAMQQQEVQTAKNRAEINRLNIQAKDRTKSEEERLALLNKASQLEEKDFKERKRISDEKLRIAYEDIRVSAELTEKEVAQLKKSGLAYKEVTEAKTSNNDELYDSLKEALLGATEVENEFYSNQEKIINKQNKLIEDGEKEKENQRQKAIEAQQKAIEAENKRIDNLINKSRQEIDLFVAQQGFKKKSTEEEYNFNKQIFDKELKDLELRYSKGKVSKLEYETEKLNLSNDFAKQNADLIIQNAEHEVNLIKDKNQKILDEDLFLSDEILKNKKKSIDDIAKAEREGLWLKKQLGLIIEQEYQDGLILIKQNADQKKTELDVTKDTQERERKAIDLENKRANDQLTFEQDVELQREQNAIKLEEELLNAENLGANKKLIEDKYANLDKQLTQSVQDFKLQSLSNTFGQISNLFGQQSKIGKAFALYQAGIDGYQSVLKAFNSQFIAGDPSSLPRAIGAGALAGAFAVKQIAGIAGAKFEKGGIQEIGGKRHSAGGTKFIGSDGTTFEAEAGEGIGILNRSAFSTFMDFNNRFGSGTSSNGFFQGGGIITQGIKNESINLDSVVNAIAQIPPPIVAVEEIQSVGNRFVSVQQTANL
jgi:hypothetical protein